MKSKRLFIVNAITSAFPPSKLYSLKSILYKWAGVELGDNVRIVSSVKIWGAGRLIIGHNTFIGHQTLILLGGGMINIANDVDISSNVVIVNGSHKKGVDKGAGEGTYTNIFIESGAWLGASTTIIAGGNVGVNCIVGAGSLVNKSLIPQGVYAGVPAKMLSSN